VQETRDYLNTLGIETKLLNNVYFAKSNEIGLLVSTIKNGTELDFQIRREAILKKTPYSTNIETAKILVEALAEYRKNGIKIVD